MTDYRQLGKKIAKYGTIATLGLATLIGSCTSHKKDCPPLYTIKTGTSYGICAGLVTSFEPNSKFYGLVISGVNLNDGQINGAVISGGNVNARHINGAALSGLNTSLGANAALNGLEIAIIGNGPHRITTDFPEKVNGLQLGLTINIARENGRALQIGLYNKSGDPQTGETVRSGLGFGYTRGDKK
jgi:hypothetical protein